jgi:hypothetical protein
VPFQNNESFQKNIPNAIALSDDAGEASSLPGLIPFLYRSFSDEVFPPRIGNADERNFRSGASALDFTGSEGGGRFH